MKKLVIAAVAAAAMAATVAAGCKEEGKAFSEYAEAYKNAAAATSVTEEIEIKNGQLTPYSYQKQYTATAEGYSYEYTEKKYNDIITGDEDLYSEDSGTGVVQKPQTAVLNLSLDSSLYVSMTATGQTLTCEVSEEGVYAALSLADELPASISGAVITLTIDGDKLTALTVDYNSSLEGEQTVYAVSITITFGYGAE